MSLKLQGPLRKSVHTARLQVIASNWLACGSPGLSKHDSHASFILRVLCTEGRIGEDIISGPPLGMPGRDL